MKYIIAAFCVFMVIEAVAARPPKPSRRPPPPRCDSSDDCGTDECCVYREVFSLFRKGVCMKLAPEGKHCSRKEDSLHGKHLFHCPCVEGLECVPEKTVKVPWGDDMRVNERCVSPTGSSAQPEPETDAPETEAPEPETEAQTEE